LNHPLTEPPGVAIKAPLIAQGFVPDIDGERPFSKSGSGGQWQHWRSRFGVLPVLAQG
jgi:hypothetical protein